MLPAKAEFEAKPLPLDLSHHWSNVSKARTPSSIKEFYRFFQIPNIGNLGGGSYPLHIPPYEAFRSYWASVE